MKELLSEDEKILVKEKDMAPPSGFDLMPRAEQNLQTFRSKLVTYIDTLIKSKKKFQKVSAVAYFHYPVWPKWRHSLFVYDPIGK